MDELDSFLNEVTIASIQTYFLTICSSKDITADFPVEATYPIDPRNNPINSHSKNYDFLYVLARAGTVITCTKEVS